MIYRDQSLACPRCRLDLARGTASEVWTCGRCRGALLGSGELVERLIAVAPDLVPERGGVRGVSMLGRRTADTLPCGACGEAMEPVFLGGLEIDRCTRDELVWFDDGELTRVLAIAEKQRAQRRGPWLVRLFSRLFGA